MIDAIRKGTQKAKSPARGAFLTFWHNHSHLSFLSFPTIILQYSHTPSTHHLRLAQGRITKARKEQDVKHKHNHKLLFPRQTSLIVYSERIITRREEMTKLTHAARKPSNPDSFPTLQLFLLGKSPPILAL